MDPLCSNLKETIKAKVGKSVIKEDIKKIKQN